MSTFPWSLLGIAPTGDARAIRSAYATRIKAMDLDADVEGYADLRDARDTALRMAKTIAPETVAEPAPEAIADDTPAEWANAAPTLAGEWEIEPALVARLAGDDGPLVERASPDFAPRDAADEDDAAVHPLTPERADPFAAPLLGGHADTAAVGSDEAPSPFARLADLLHPDGPPAPMDEAEEAEAHDVLDAVLDAIHWSPITQQSAMEEWLADLLAHAWPRSSPLLETATAAFGWEQEWGRFDARPAVEHLGSRLRGDRFRRKVTQPGHRYYRAWKELSRPGKAGLLRFLRVNPSDVRALLTGVRRHFPDVEHELDAERVASWEKKIAWPSASMIVSGLMMLGVLIHFASQETPSFEEREILNSTIELAFGAGHDAVWLRKHQIDLAEALATTRERASNGVVAQQATIDRGVDLVRARTYLDGRRLQGQDFEDTMRVRLALLRASRAHGDAACTAMMRLATPPRGTSIPGEVRVAEQRLAVRLVERGLLGIPPKAEATSARVPSVLVARVIAATGFDKDRLSRAMQGKGSDADRCAATIALLNATLEWQGPERRAILLTL